MSSSALITLGEARMACEAASTAAPAAGDCAAVGAHGAAASHNAAMKADRFTIFTYRFSLSGVQPRILQPLRKPQRQFPVDGAGNIDFRPANVVFSKSQKHPDPVGKPQMRVGQRAQLLLVVLLGLMVGCLPHLDSEQVIGD